MSKSLDIATQQLLANSGLQLNDIHNTLGQVMAHDIDMADLYFESTRTESWVLEDGIVKEGAHNIDQGVGVRAISGDKTGFAYSDEILLPALSHAASAAKAIARSGGEGKLQAWHKQYPAALYAPLDPVASISAEDKVNLLKRIDAEARRRDPRVKQVLVGLSGQQSTMLVAGSDGTLAADVRPLVRLNVNVIVEENGRIEKGGAGGGGRFGYEYFLRDDLASTYINEAVEQALTNLDAVNAPAGSMTVVLGPGWPGILLHEAIGHGLEGDFNRKKTSAFSGRLGERVASPEVTVVDDGTIRDRRGSLNVDDEGTATQCTTLIEHGILRGYMQDKHNARLMGMAPTGNGRRESYAHLPMPRMTNTYMLGGQHDPQEIIASVDKGIYAQQFGGGQVDITNGKFVFSASQAYLIEDGRLTRPIKGATLIGNGPDVLTRVSMVGNDMQLDSGIGTCGKDGQSVPVGVGQPTIRIDQLTVGGTTA
ncbi:MAG: metalloprotease TldD [Gammaproteobacteria bacterium]|nr:metalloprotease TldD [Gammaproteobacteria bacterium]NIN60917.1 metalloprotease TldD [Gammaproteobacteria bacterium]NIO62541.1 metalloprotease TldD [Gammaproteobacteria bacterium]NIP49542.1 metalloprotease TldD [Gammaproteobacteria bacterium]NIQ10766.1 metalloprotease TldD [Gammaproteobacteria bacterium]